MTDPGLTQAQLRALLAQVIQQTTGVEVDVDAGFFSAGLTSLLLVRVHDQLLSRLGRPRSLAMLFKYTTIRSLAAYLLAPADDPRPVPGTRTGPDDRAPVGQARRDLRARIRARDGGHR